MKNRNYLKSLIIGYGSIGKRHIKNLNSISNMELIIYTKQKIKLKDKNYKVYNSMNKCLKEKPTIAIIANETSYHVEAAIKAASAGCHLFIEKPLSNSMKRVKVLQTLVKNKKLVTQIGCNLRFHKCIKKIKDLILKNEIGQIISARVECGTYLPDWHPYEDYRLSYASRKELGGGVILTCIHEIDYLYWFFGDAKEVFSMSGQLSNLDISVDDFASILIRFKNNVIADIHLDYFQRSDFRSCKLIGTNGIIFWDSDTNEVTVYKPKKKKWIKKIKIKNYDKNQEYVDEMKHFLKNIDKKSKSINDLNQGVKTLEIALDAIKSSKTKKLIKVR